MKKAATRTLSLTDYPDAIAKLEQELLQADRHILALTEALSLRDAEIEKLVAYDEALTNDAKRKARRQELKDAPSYKGRLMDLQTAKDQRAEMKIDLDRLENMFSILKLEKREAIARLEKHVAA